MPSTSWPLADAFIEGWKTYQQRLVIELRPLTPEQFTIRVAPNLRSVGEIVTHLVAGRAFWFGVILKEGGDEIAAIANWDDDGQPVRSPAECVQALETTWNLVEDALSCWTTEDLTEQIILPWIGPEYPITRAWVAWHVLEHDLHHGGELSHSLGMQGLLVRLPPPPPE
jgi:uncharacterized damage-inducible protein DinB